MVAKKTERLRWWVKYPHLICQLASKINRDQFMNQIHQQPINYQQCKKNQHMVYQGKPMEVLTHQTPSGNKISARLTTNWSRNSTKNRGRICWFLRRTCIKWSKEASISRKCREESRMMPGERRRRSELWSRCRRKKSSRGVHLHHRWRPKRKINLRRET